MLEKLQDSLLDIGDYISLGWSEFTKNFKAFVIITLFINLPIAIVGLFLPSEVEPSPTDAMMTLLYVILSTILGTLAAVAAIKMVDRSILGQKSSANMALKSAIPKVFIAVSISILTAIVVGIGLILLVIPGIWLAILLSFTMHAIALRGCGLNALSYSRSIVKDRWWAVFGRTSLLGFCLILLMIILAIAVGIIFALLNLANLSALDIAVELISTLIFALINYYAITVYTVVFLNFDYTRNPPQQLSEDLI
ncbi:MAG: hypothetical protein WBA13_16970 [Microcoleaceae cyanobacterium]